MNLRLLLIFIHIHVEGLRWHGKNHESHKEMFESLGANKSILATIRELVKYLMELYLHSREWVAGLNMEGSWRTMVVSQLKIEEMKTLR